MVILITPSSSAINLQESKKITQNSNSEVLNIAHYCTLTMDIPAQIDLTPADINIRPFKRRKFYRKRGDGDETPTINDINSETNKNNDIARPLTIEGPIFHHGNYQHVVEQGLEKDSRLPAAQILRQRKAAQRRRGGIEFTNTSNTRISAAAPQDNDALIEKDDTTQEIKTVVDRFAPQTGQVADVDKHM